MEISVLDMMATTDLKVQLKDVAPCEKELRVEIPPERVAAEFEEVYRDLKKVAHVPGFRVGSAPRDLLERHHGEKARKDVLDRLLDRSLEEALNSQGKLDLIGRPVVTDIQFNPKQPLTYQVKLEVAPAVPLGRYKELRLSRPKIQISEEAVAQVLARMQEEQAQLRPILEPRASQEGDFLLADLTEQAAPAPSGGGKKSGGGAKRRDVLIVLDAQKDPKGIFKPLYGMGVSEQRNVKLEDGTLLTVELKGLKVKDLPPLDDAFARIVGASPDSLEGLKGAIREGLQRQGEISQRQALEAQAVHQLLEEWRVEVPPSLVASQARRLLKERAVELMNQGVPPAQVEERAQGMADQVKLDALKQVKLFFVLRRIASAERISAAEEEIQARVENLAKHFQRSAQEMRRELQSKDLLEEIRWGIVRNKVMDLILKEAQNQEGS